MMLMSLRCKGTKFFIISNEDTMKSSITTPIMASEGITHLQLHIFAVARINHGCSTSDGGTVEITGGTQLGRTSQARRVFMAILHERISTQSRPAIHLIVICIERSTLIAVKTGSIVGLESGNP